MATTTTRYVCARCGCTVHYWHFGWKHARGWRSKTPSCGQKPVPVPIKTTEES